MCAARKSSPKLKGSKFPYQYLLGWTWPEHIEKLLRRLLWTSLTESCQTERGLISPTVQLSDYVAMRLFWLIAVHPESPGAVLDLISRLHNERYAERVAENPQTWTSTLRRLAAHPSVQVRMAVAQHPSTPADVYLQLSRDANPDVRYIIAECLHRDINVLTQLAEDEQCYVAQRAKRSLARLLLQEPVQMPQRLRSTRSNQVPKRAAQG